MIRTNDQYELPTYEKELDPAWRQQAACTGTDIDDFYGRSTAEARFALCANCPVAWECFSFAANNDINYGVWGGLSSADRRNLLRVHAWALTPRARADHQRQLVTLRGRKRRNRC